MVPGRVRDQIRTELPPEAEPIFRCESLTFGVVLGSGVKVDLRAAYRTEEGAQEAEKAVKAAADTGRKKLGEARTKMEEMAKGKPGRPTPRPLEDLPEAIGGVFGLGAITMLDEWLADPPLTRDGKELSATVTLPSLGGASMQANAVMIGLLLPAVQKTRDAAGRAQDQNNMKQMALALHVYGDLNNGRTPPASFGNTFVNGSATGNLSWRVAILPFIDQQALYSQFKLDEPWDSEHNKKLIPLMPKVFASPRYPTEPGKTYYKAIVGPGAGFEGKQAVRFPAGFSDGLSNTIAFVEGGEPVIWTKPDDFVYDPKKPLPNLGMPGVDVVTVAMFDGSVRTVNLKAISEKTLRAAITRNGNEILGNDW
jgi:hypothetical protein